MSARLAKRPLIEPTYWTCPHGVRVRPEPGLTYGPEVADICDRAGFTPDPQQELGLDLVFAIRPDGSPASFSFCIICARQNLKSGLFLQCCIGWLFVTEVPEIAWSAHELKTSLDAQEEFFTILEDGFLSKYLPATPNAGKYDTNGKERQELSTGQTLWFQTRTINGGRGLKKPKVIIDEAFKFKKRTADALIPIMLAQHHPQLLYGSSEPPVDTDSEQLRDVIDRGQNHKSPELSFLQWRAPREECSDPDCRHPKDALAQGIDCALDREHLLLAANPTVHRDDQGHALETGRISMRTLRNTRQELSPEGYMRECLGWPEELADTRPPALELKLWTHTDVRKPNTPAPASACVVLDVEPDLSAATLGVAGLTAGGRTLVMTHTTTIDDAVTTLKTLRESVKLLEVALHPSAQAGALIPALTKEKIEFEKLTHADLGRGCTTFKTGIPKMRFVHLGQAELDAAVTVARTRKTGPRGELELWDRQASPVPLGSLVAASTAAYRHALKTAKPDTPPPPPEALDEDGDFSDPLDDFAVQTIGF